MNNYEFFLLYIKYLSVRIVQEKNVLYFIRFIFNILINSDNILSDKLS